MLLLTNSTKKENKYGFVRPHQFNFLVLGFFQKNIGQAVGKNFFLNCKKSVVNLFNTKKQRKVVKFSVFHGMIYPMNLFL